MTCAISAATLREKASSLWLGLGLGLGSGLGLGVGSGLGVTALLQRVGRGAHDHQPVEKVDGHAVRRDDLGAAHGAHAAWLG